MTISVSYLAKEGYVLATFDGAVTAEFIELFNRQIMPVSLASHCYNILVDYRKVSMRLRSFEIMKADDVVIELFESNGIPIYLMRRAIVTSKDSKFTDNFSFLENVTENRGLSVRAFTDMDEATKWLIEEK